ncbi:MULTISPECIES: hypothetical protein [Vibrio harveyi group]|uniref:hypothetical protein n=1 Tax=Vibrio harveyi group TaxID=717610 RepID=UPI0015F563D6|nr:hypothetical protein [Vibrio alginolyticus]HDM8060756.1 hypothetical protein [Vibrio harveyi]
MKKVTYAYIKSLNGKVITPIQNHLTALLDKGFKVEFNLETCEGKAKKGALEFNFDIGGENFYISYTAHTKCDIEPVLDKLEELERIMD